MRTSFILLAFVWFSCGRTEKTSDNDSTAIWDAIAPDSTNKPLLDWGYKADFYQVSVPLDTSLFQRIDKTCVIWIAENADQKMARETLREAELKELAEQEEKARLEWESQPHDSSEYFQWEGAGYEGDGDYYKMKAKEYITELGIPVVTASPKQYVRLIGRKGKEYTLDIRSNMQPDWTVILFHIDREPVIVDAMEISKERLLEYFLLK